MNAERKIQKARTELILSQPWFGTLALKLQIEQAPAELWTCRGGMPTMATDGTRLYYYPEFVDSLSEVELLGVIAHEVMHCALLHPFRRDTRDVIKWNFATDYVINGQLTECGFTLPKGCLLDKKFDGLSAEQVYPQLPDQQRDQQKQKGKGQGQGGMGIGGVMDAPKDPAKNDPASSSPGTANDPTDANMTEADWEIAVTQAERVASAAGRMPAGISRSIGKVREGKVDWKAALRRFLQNTVACDYSWSHPNRRFIGRGMYLPGLRKENIGEIGVVVDTSGSIGGPMLDDFASEISAIMAETRPEKITVIYCDAAVHGEPEEFTPDNGEIVLNPRGGGGTAFQPAFTWIEENRETPPIAVIYLTDLMSSDTPLDPGYPVLWVTPDWITQGAPFGELLRIPDCGHGY